MPQQSQTTNHRLANTLVQHSHYIIAVEAGLAALISGRMSAAVNKAARLIVGMQIDPELAVTYETARLIASFLVPDIQQEVYSIYVDVRNELLDLAIAEDKAILGILNDVLPAPVAMALDNAPLTLAAANSIVNEPIAGTSLPSRVNGLIEEASRNVQAALANAVAMNATSEELTSMLSKYLQTGVTAALTVMATTEAQRVANSAQQLVFGSNKHILYGVQYTAVMDARTCPTCEMLDGTFYSYVSGDTPPTVPRHPHCRCMYVGVIKSWKDLGFKQTDVDSLTSLSELHGEALATSDYPSWLANQPPSVQLRILGPKKYATYAAGISKPPTSARNAVPLSTPRLRAKDIAYLRGM
jgi:SPP1 gp7 family putative phage head morphogenesis protein